MAKCRRLNRPWKGKTGTALEEIERWSWTTGAWGKVTLAGAAHWWDVETVGHRHVYKLCGLEGVEISPVGKNKISLLWTFQNPLRLILHSCKETTKRGILASLSSSPSDWTEGLFALIKGHVHHQFPLARTCQLKLQSLDPSNNLEQLLASTSRRNGLWLQDHIQVSEQKSSHEEPTTNWYWLHTCSPAWTCKGVWETTALQAALLRN